MPSMPVVRSSPRWLTGAPAAAPPPDDSGRYSAGTSVAEGSLAVHDRLHYASPLQCHGSRNRHSTGGNRGSPAPVSARDESLSFTCHQRLQQDMLQGTGRGQHGRLQHLQGRAPDRLQQLRVILRDRLQAVGCRDRN